MQNLEELADQHMSETLDKILQQDKEYQKRKKQYCEVLEEIKKHLNLKNSKDHNLFLKLDEIVGDYSASYGDATYSLGYREGVAIGLEYGNTVREQQKTKNITIEDMTDLIKAYDAYNALNIELHGTHKICTYDKEIFGGMGMVYDIINRHISPKFQENDRYDKKKILADTSIEPKERARLLMMAK
ncbi:MAG: hypothetical protein K2N63_12275 [Lachnospiraceae bacterium]|nr:hypothetical protein [Lachnospiraceae bacterium]